MGMKNGYFLSFSAEDRGDLWPDTTLHFAIILRGGRVT